MAYQKEQENNGDGSRTTTLPFEANSTTAVVKAKRRKFDIEELDQFLDWPEYSYWRGFIRLKQNEKWVVQDILTKKARKSIKQKVLTK
jgi:hypothetical protein